MVGHKVLAVHPGTGHVRSGSILTFDSNKYHIQFDRQELGVCLISDTQITPIEGENKYPEYVPVPTRNPIENSSFLVGEKFKAGINIYSMAFLLRLLERKEALIELLKEYNRE